MISLSLEMIVILLLVAFIVGMIAGRPRIY
jgi:predicted Kef-type K+ transport protein